MKEEEEEEDKTNTQQRVTNFISRSIASSNSCIQMTIFSALLSLLASDVRRCNKYYSLAKTTSQSADNKVDFFRLIEL